MKNKTLFIISGALVFLGLIGVLSFRFLGQQERIRPKRGDIIESIYGLGTVTADRVYRVRTGLTLSIKKLLVKEGDLVKQGDSLVLLEDNLVRSPIEGTVTAVAYKEGELVTPQVSIVTVTNLNKLYLEVSLEQQSILRVKEGQLVYVSFESLRNEKTEGVVKSVYPRENQFIVRIELGAWPMGVLPGMTADVAILVGRRTNVLMIPLRSLLAGQVFRLREGKKEKISAKLGVLDGEWGEVISDNISETDELLIRK
jgi:macrolide-specific efflux system membrane fusion protein